MREKPLLRVSSDVANRALLCLFLILHGWQLDGEVPLRGNGLFILFWGCIHLFMPLPFQGGFLWGYDGWVFCCLGLALFLNGENRTQLFHLFHKVSPLDNHRIIQAGRDLKRALDQSPSPSRICSDQIAQGCSQMGLENLQGLPAQFVQLPPLPVVVLSSR